MMNLKHLVRSLVLMLVVFTANAWADLNITITQGAVGATPIGIVPFAWNGQGQAPQLIGQIVANDLMRSGLFAPMAPAKMPQQPTQPSDIQFNSWSQVGVSDIVIGGVQEVSPGQYSVRFQLFDTLQGQQLMGYTIRASTAQLRQAAHRISDLVYQKLTGQRGAFDTHIAYVSTEVKQGRIARYSIMVADADGYNPHVIFTSPRPLSAPTWSPDGKYLAYVSFEKGHSAIYLQDLASAKRELISDRPGLNSAPAFSPDGSKLAMTLTHNGNAEIYIMDLATRKLTQFTHDPSINTGAAWMPDGKSIVFTSDRGGSPQLYVKPLQNGAAQRLTFDGNYNAAPAVSPDGTKIVFVHSNNGGFSIGLLNLDTGQTSLLTNGQLDESPSFAPNGSMVLYSTDYRGRSVLAAVSVDGRVRQRLSGPENVSQPSWSPFGD